MTSQAAFYAAATPRPGTEEAFEQSLHRLAGRRTVDGVRLSVLEIEDSRAVLCGEMPKDRCPTRPEALATYLEDQLIVRVGVYVNLDVNIN
ncbi:hypothetical protein ACFQ36_18320 [Arthrobacter sp. GCM10027362]|uniref:hypothetical protein n=1 Tax=Arthrobacter sp. GCM10027362 TaxID=3273379 RepID=UPI00363A71CA